MPPAITASPHLATPSHAYCIAPTSRSPRPSPSLARVCPRRKNSNQNDLCSKFSSLTGFSHFRFEGEDPLEVLHHFQQMEQRPCHPVQLPHHQGIARMQCL